MLCTFLTNSHFIARNNAEILWTTDEVTASLTRCLLLHCYCSDRQITRNIVARLRHKAGRHVLLGFSQQPSNSSWKQSLEVPGGNSMLKLRPASERCPQLLISFFKKIFSKAVYISYKHRGCSNQRCFFFYVKSALSYLSRMLPSISKITPTCL